MKVVRKTQESVICVTLTPKGANDKQLLTTSNHMLSHMLEHIAHRSNIAISVSCDYENGFALDHVLFEDLGIALGRAFGELLQQTDGAYGYGDAVGIIDEALARCAMSFESRSLLVFSSDAAIPDLCEDTKSEDLKTFLEGFCQGAQCTLHMHIERGENAHHIWEAVYRSLGSALEAVFTVVPSRVQKTSGVAGKITFEVTP